MEVVAWSPDGTQIASSSDATIKVWSAITGETLLTYQGHTDRISALSWSPDGKYLASKDRGAFYTSKINQQNTFQMSFSSDLEYLASRDTDFFDTWEKFNELNTLQIWEASTGKVILTRLCHPIDARFIGWSPDGKYLVFSKRNLLYPDGRHAGFSKEDILREDLVNVIAEVLEVKTGSKKLELTITGPWYLSSVVALFWCPDGARILSAEDDGTVRVWESASGKLLLTYTGLNPQLSATAWSPDGTRLAALGTLSGRVRTLSTGNRKAIMETHPLVEVNQPLLLPTLAWSPDNTRFTLASTDLTISVYDAVTGNILLTYRGHSSSVRTIAWSPDGSRLASGDEEGQVHIWDAGTGNHLLTYEGHAGAVYALAWAPEGIRIASGSSDNTIQVWLAV